MTPATATPPTTISLVEEERPSYTPRVTQLPSSEPLPLDPFGAAFHALIDLENGWDSYGALAPTQVAIMSAWTAASSLSEYGALPQVFPTRRGGVQLEWHTPNTALEWEIDPNGGTGVFIFDNHVTGERFDGEIPADVYRLGLGLAQVYTDR